MKKYKVLAVLMATVVLFGVYFTSAFAFGDALGALGEYFGLSGNNGGGNNAGNPDDNDDYSTKGNSQVNLGSGFSEILQGVLGSAANSLTDSQISEILNNFDINDLLGGDSDVINEVLELIGANQPTKSDDDDDNNNGGNSGNSGTQSSTPSNTVPQYTNVYVTEAPAVTYSYNGTTAAVTTTMFGETTTGIGETTTLSYVAPSQIYAESLTTLPFDYQVNNEEQLKEKDGVTLKMIIGIAILLISGVAVVGVALSLKKSRV